MKYRITVLTVFFALVCLSLSSCHRGGKASHTQGTVRMACDASFENIIEQEIQVFEYIYNDANVLCRYLPEYQVVDSLLKGDVRIAVATRELTKKEVEYMKKQYNRNVHQLPIAVDAVALIVNPENPIMRIDYNDVIDILTGKYTTWDKITPDNKGLGNIKVVFDGNGSSVMRYMTDSVMGGQAFGPNVFTEKNSRDVIAAVEKDKNSIGMVGVSWITDDLGSRQATPEEMNRLTNPEAADTTQVDFKSGIKVLAVQPKGQVNYYKPTQLNIYQGNYPFHRQMFLISTSSPHSVGHSFFSFVTSAQGQKLILTTGVCPKRVSAQFVEIGDGRK